MRRYLIAAMALTLAIALLPAGAYAHTADAPYRTDLVAGRDKVDVGDVLVWNDARYVYVKYVTSPGWELGLTHLAIASDWKLIPQAKGNAIPGRFPYKGTHDPSAPYDYRIKNTWPAWTTIAIAAHGEVTGPCGDCTPAGCGTLPAVVDFMASEGTNAYFQTTLGGGTALDGTYDGWCSQLDIGFTYDWMFKSEVYCSYGPGLPTWAVDKPENLDLVNWLLNQQFVGKPAPVALYSAGDVQMAIWKLLDTSPVPDGYLGSVPANVEALVAASMMHDGFVPACGQRVALVLLPFVTYEGGTTNYTQPNLVTRPVQCDRRCDETVWGLGSDFPGKNWSMYFTYQTQSQDE